MSAEMLDKKYKCPVCEKEFTSKKPKTAHVRVEKMDDDFCSYYKTVNPVFYTPIVCPECGYSSLEGNFDDINESQKQMVRDNISANWNGRDYTGIRDLSKALDAYKLVFLTYNIIHYKYSEIGKVCLRLAWICRYLEDEKEIEYLKFATSNFEKAYTNERLDEDPDNELNVLYLLGELFRRVGNYKKSIDWFAMTLQLPLIKEKKHMEKRARDQWFVAKEEFAKQKREAKKEDQ